MLRPLSLTVCLGASLVVTLAVAQDAAVTPPAPLVENAAPPAPLVTDAAPAAPAMIGDGPTYQECPPAYPCASECLDGSGCVGCCQGGFGHPCAHHGFGICHHSKWPCLRKLHSTCDMYPHYPYCPEYHGYYYFRPYNFSHIFQHTEEAMAILGTPWHPYSVSIFETIPIPVGPELPGYEDSEEHQLLPIHRSLPQLEDLLNAGG